MIYVDSPLSLSKRCVNNLSEFQEFFKEEHEPRVTLKDSFKLYVRIITGNVRLVIEIGREKFDVGILVGACI